MINMEKESASDGTGDTCTTVTPVLERVSPRTIPGALTNNNKGAVDWGWQSFVAYGCHKHVVVLDTKHLKVFQTLTKHKGDVIKVKWSKECHYHDSFNPYNLYLASSDTTGVIIVWDVKQGLSKSTLSDGNKAVSDMEWVTGSDCCHHLLVALHPPYSIILWNTETGSKMWKKAYTEVLQSFAFDPFAENNMAFLASDCILFVDDFNLTKVPSSNGRKFFVSNPSSVLGSQLALNTSGHPTVEDKSKPVSRSLLPRRMKFLIKADTKSYIEERISLNDCLQLTYHRAYRHHLLLLYPREILILDLEINQTVGIVAIDGTSSMVQLYSCSQRDVLYCMHETGSVGVRVRHRGNISTTSPDGGDSLSLCSTESYLEVAYDIRCQSDPLRLTKHARVMGMSVSPVTECQIALLISDGRVIFLELHASNQSLTNNSSNLVFPLHTLNLAESLDVFELPSHEGDDVIPSVPFVSRTCPCTTLADKIGSVITFTENVKKNLLSAPGITLRMLLTGVHNGLAPMPHVIRMCPPVTFRNWTSYHPFLAVGNSNGSIQIFNMSTGTLEREFSLHTAPVRGIEWTSLTSFLSYAHPNLINNMGQLRNELVYTDFPSGRSRSLRTDRNEESPIELLRVSYLRQYFIVIFKEEPFELWDVTTLTLLRTMPKNFPMITALSWSPLHKKLDKSKDVTSTYNMPLSPNASESQKMLMPVKEHIVFTDTNGQLYHFTVEGNIVRDGLRIPPDAGMGSITSIAWKADKIVLSDVDGNLNLWDIKDKMCRRISTQRGWIKKIQFGPGKGNMKILLLYNDGVDLWDIKDGLLVSQIKCPRDMPKTQDIDWASSDRPVLATADGCICITDINLKVTTSPVLEYQPTVFPFCPQILLTKTALNLKCMLQHQPWRKNFNLEFDTKDGFNTDELFLMEKQLEYIDIELKNSLKDSQFGVAERCLHVARLFGDEDGCHFWTVVLHYLKREKVYPNLKGCTEGTALQTEHDVDLATRYFIDQPLDSSYDILCDNQSYKKLQLDRVSLHDIKRSTYAQTQKCAETLVLLGQTERAVQLLLETEADNDNFYTDWLRACLMATVQSSGASQSVIKLVATNLIASGSISEGVQLLCLIDKALDACRYLQGAGYWDQAVWLAKATLNHHECLEILKRWTDHLCSTQTNQRSKAILVFVSLGQFHKVLEMLHAMKMTERAALFLQACQEFGIITRNENTSTLIDTVLLDYARYLLSIGNRTAALYFCNIVGEIAQDLRKEIEILCEDL